MARTPPVERAAEGAAGADYRRVLRRQTIARALRMRPIYLLLSLSLAMLILWRYVPIYGLSLAFKDFSLHNGWLGSPWNNFDHFKRMVTDPFFGRVLFNTVWLSVLRILFAFPAPIIMALLLNEMRSPWYKRTVQSVSYLPHFVSWVILGGIFAQILNLKRGPIAWIFVQLGLEPINWLTHEPTFRGLIVVTGICRPSAGRRSVPGRAGLGRPQPVRGGRDRRRQLPAGAAHHAAGAGAGDDDPGCFRSPTCSTSSSTRSSTCPTPR